ncbi:sensor histidine kinase KdpD [Geomicrobium sp. JCM 19039]|uniref:sensor histidine kinase n=1 Tax=Geomicrobium sp. JCM 19039 TaxID=1460636 RepID=UPI00045F1AE3|nr:HAMP domain-containing sensor histidine kinase [Geomicrobium sp. JCM 19039]GAK10753.1 sensor protein ResE [Geomicrobium sp. JCM 19039]
MLRNREIRLLLVSQLIICLVAITGVLIFPNAALIMMISLSILLITVHLSFTHWKYKRLQRLSAYLQQINAGDYTLDVRDNEEGELSILKNNIYKVTTRLADYSAGLKGDKEKLTEAISDVSHQLKTPITSMMVMADLLERDNLDVAKRQQFTKVIQEQLERLDWLVSSLLKLSKMDAGTIAFKRDRFDMNTLVEDALKPMLISIDLKGLTINRVGNDESRLVADYHWTKEALINILKNAVEHSHPGKTLTIHYHENALYQEIEVTDYGSGIPKHDVPYVFKRFYKGENAGDNSVGIGLAMAYQIVTRQGGDLEVRSEEGIGTTFSMKFYKQTI